MIALYGGSFDPFHNGHVRAVESALATGWFSEVWVHVVKDHAFGKRLSPLEARMEMAQKALEGLPVRFLVQDEVYTVDMIERLTEEHPEAQFLMVMGSDCYRDAESGKWHRWDRIRQLTGPPVVMGREKEYISSTQIRKLLQQCKDVGHLLPEGIVSIIDRYGLYGSRNCDRPTSKTQAKKQSGPVVGTCPTGGW